MSGDVIIHRTSFIIIAEQQYSTFLWTNQNFLCIRTVFFKVGSYTRVVKQGLLGFLPLGQNPCSNYINVNSWMLFLLYWMPAWHWVTSCATVSSNQKPVFISLVSHLKSLVLSVPDVPIKVLQVNFEHDVISGCQTVKIVVPKPKLAVNISKAVLVGRPAKIKVNRAVQTLLKNGPASTVRGHVAINLHRFAAIWIDGVHAIGCDTILKELGAAFSISWWLKKNPFWWAFTRQYLSSLHVSPRDPP